MSDERDDGTVHIPVRVPDEEPERDKSAPDGDEPEASSGEAQTSAAAEEPAAEGEPASGDDDEPEIVAINDEPPDDGSAEEIEIIAVEDDEVSHPPPPISDTVEMSRARLSEMGREKLKLEGEIKTLQGEAYQAKLDARGLEEKIAALEDQAARRQAEFQNFRRRADKQREEALRYKDADLLEELLPVLDNFERAMSAPPAPDSLEEFHKGVELIQKQLYDSLARFELAAIEATGTAFDPNFHEAVTRSASDDVPDDHVKSELRRGYMYKDRLLRAAMVEVSTGPADAGAASEAESPPTTDDEPAAPQASDDGAADGDDRPEGTAEE